MSIATTRGDGGETSLAGGVRVSKAHLRVEAYGTVDELNTFMGLARVMNDDPEVKDLVKTLQRELFKVGSALATAPNGRKPEPPITVEMVEALTAHVHRIEATDGILADWSLPGEHPASAAFDVARTVCRRAERQVVRLIESGEPVNAQVLAYLNRLSDLLWLLGRLVEKQAGVSARLRDDTKPGAKWSRAW
ncbi:MAG TPA: cob(I)yrinic acid a,c-diamide adenosyltransferase [Vicinamibacterales bacterium]|jgi:cob(I)alamin adenosyltransferase|nr:cob(I)yrinic acid a,c-diamide adenosyltransferase [Vicinamibacterales bacterium]